MALILLLNSRMKVSKKFKPIKNVYDHASEISRVRKIIGQLEGIEKMILGKRYPPQTLQQVKAASAALMALRFEILKRYLNECLEEANESGNHAKLIEQILESAQMQAIK